MSIFRRKLNSVSLQEGQEPTHIHENGVLTLNRTSELEDSNDFVFEKVGPKDTHDLENGHRHHHGDVVNDLQTSTEGRDRYSTINSEDELLNGEPFLFENMTMDVKNDHADRGPDSECERVVTDRVDERTKDDGGAADVVDGGESKMEVKSDESVYRGTVDAAAASEPIPVPSSKKDSADKSIETSSETLVSENLFSR